MGNPFFNPQQGPQSVPLNNVVEMFKKMRSMGNNPQQVMNLLMNKSPKFRKIMDEINQSGMNPMQYAMQKANEKNVVLNPTLQQLYDISNQKF